MSANLSWNSPAPLGLRAGAGLAVIAVHAGIVAAIAMMGPEPMQITQPEAVAVRFLEIAPEVQTVDAPPAPTPPAPKPEAKPQPKPKPEPKPLPKPKPKPTPQPTPEPTPEPLPVSESAISAPPAPPAEAPAPESTSKAPPSGTPDASTRAAAPAAQPSDQPKLIGQVNYDGAPPEAVYPRISTRMREEGVTTIRVTIGTRGNVVRAVVQKSSGYQRLDDAALDAARKSRFKPYTENGVAFEGYADIPFNFRLKD